MSVRCYRAKIVGSVMNAQEIDFEDVNTLPGIKLVFNWKSSYNGNGSANISVFKDSEELQSISLNGWTISDGNYAYSWGNSGIYFTFTDCVGMSCEIRLVKGSGSMNNNGPSTLEDKIAVSYKELVRITQKYDTIAMYKLCEEEKQEDKNHQCHSLDSFGDFLDRYATFVKKIKETRASIIKHPERAKDRNAFRTKLKQFALDSISINASNTISPEAFDIPEPDNP